MNQALKGSQQGMTERSGSGRGPSQRAAAVGRVVCVRATVGACRRRQERWEMAGLHFGDSQVLKHRGFLDETP